MEGSKTLQQSLDREGKRNYMRTSGILLPISSLPSPYGIGTFSKEAYDFVDFLAESGMTYWQILPLGPTGYGDSPYQSFSTFAGNPYFIDLVDLIERKWLTKAECDAISVFDENVYVDYEKIYNTRFQLLRKAFERSGIKQDKDFQTFIKKNAFWLDDYALYMSIKNAQNGISYVEWPKELRYRERKALEECREKYASDIMFYQFQQYLFKVQWLKLKKYANEKGIEIIGDIPIYVAFDSADTWANPELFQFDEDGYPIAVAGCPPDAFSITGQLWGNPLYDWEYHDKTGYAWWIARMRNCFELYDMVRIDHFRGFDEYYAIPYGDETAEFGTWEKGPNVKLFQAIEKALGKKKVIAEDLGFLTDTVVEMVQKTGFPSMKVTQFGFAPGEDSEYLPHNFTRNCVVYTGTHDNETTYGWYLSSPKEVQKYVRDYLNVWEGASTEHIVWSMIRGALASCADTAIIPMQDYLTLDNTARINTPSTIGENWKWRLKDGQISAELAKKILELNMVYARIPKKDEEVEEESE